MAQRALGPQWSQKGLFPAAPYMSPEARYPRGYTPERMRAVQRALPALDVVEPPEESLEHKGGTRKAFTALHIRGVHETIARSTVPLEHLNGIGYVVSNDNALDMGNGNMAGGVRRHLYTPGRSEIAIQPMHTTVGSSRVGRRDRGMSDRDLARHAAIGHTLIHEIGHHVSQPETRPDRSFVHGSMGWSYDPVEEATADDYAEKHWRHDPRLKTTWRPSSGYEDDNHADYWDTRDRLLNLRRPPSYYGSRPPAPPRAQRIAEQQTLW